MGKLNGKGSRPCMTIWIHIKTLPSAVCDWEEEAVRPISPLPPCCFNRLLLWQSAGICLQNGYVWDRRVRCSAAYFMSFIGFPRVMKGHKCHWIMPQLSWYWTLLCDIKRRHLSQTLGRFSGRKMATFCKVQKAQRKLNPIIWDVFILPSASLGLSADMLIWQGPSVSPCWTLLRRTRVCSDLVKKCCLKQRWDRSKCCGEIWLHHGPQRSACYLLQLWGIGTLSPSRLLISDFGKKEACSILCFDHQGFLCLHAE